MAVIPDGYLDLLEKKITFANLATVLKDGSPQVTPIWFDYTGGKIRINTARGRVKARTLKEGARVALAILDPVRRLLESFSPGKVVKADQQRRSRSPQPCSEPGQLRRLGLLLLFLLRLQMDVRLCRWV